MLSRSYYLHQARVCLSLARLTDDANAKRRLEQMALSFAERIGGSDDSEIAQIFAVVTPRNRPTSGFARELKKAKPRRGITTPLTTHNKAGGLLLDSPRRREAAFTFPNAKSSSSNGCRLVDHRAW